MPLSEKALLVTLSLSGGFSPTKTDKRISRKVNDQHNARNGALRVSKRLLLDEAIDPIRKLHGEIRDYHYTNTLPWGENERLLPSALYLDYAAWMRQRRAEVDNAIDTFIRDYPQNVAAAREVLQSAFNPSDYPTTQTIRGKFGFKLDYKPLPDAGDFRISILREEMDELRNSLNTRIEEAQREAMRDVARRMAEPLANRSPASPIPTAVSTTPSSAISRRSQISSPPSTSPETPKSKPSASASNPNSATPTQDY